MLVYATSCSASSCRPPNLNVSTRCCSATTPRGLQPCTNHCSSGFITTSCDHQSQLIIRAHYYVTIWVCDSTAAGCMHGCCCMRCLAPAPRPAESDTHARMHRRRPSDPAAPREPPRALVPPALGRPCDPPRCFAQLHPHRRPAPSALARRSQQQRVVGRRLLLRRLPSAAAGAHTVRCRPTEQVRASIGRCPATSAQQLHTLWVADLGRRRRSAAPACSTWVGAGGQQHSLAPPTRGCPLQRRAAPPSASPHPASSISSRRTT